MIIRVNNIKCDVTIGGKDNLLPFDIIKEMRDYLSVPVPGAYFTKAYKKKIWDGKQRFCTPKGSFATGFLPAVYNFLVSKGANVIIEDERDNLPEFNEYFDPVIGDWNLKTYADGYQADAVKAGFNWITLGDNELFFPRGIYDMATNAGKNSLIAGIHKNTTGKSIMILHNALIFKQAIKFFSTMFDVGIIDSKKYKPTDFTIAMYKSLYNKAKKSVNVKKDLTEYVNMFVDESHRGGGNEYSKLLTMVPAGGRYFVSGTPLEGKNKGRNLMLIGLSGPTLYQVTNKQLIDKNVSAKPTVKIYLNTPPFEQRLNYSETVDNVVRYSPERLDIIGEYCKKYPDRSILIMVEHQAHAEYINNELLEQHLVYSEFTHSTDKLKSMKIESFKNGDIKILISTMILKEGANIPIIRALIMTQGGNSSTTIKQVCGRGLRMGEEGQEEADKLDIIDFYDDAKWVAKHSRDRIRIYKKEEFDIEYQYSADGRGFPK